MKWIIFLTTVFISDICSGQSLRDIFLGIPFNYIGLDKAQRDSLINNFVDGRNDYQHGVSKARHYLTAYEPKNSFLLFTGEYEGATMMTYWNVSSGDKLVGIVSSSCGGRCENTINFLSLSGTSFKGLKFDTVVPSLSFSDFIDVKKMKIDKIDIEKERSIFDSYDLLYHLPKKGKNIVVESQYNDLDMDDELKQYILGGKIELIWKDGKFIKGNLIH